MCAADHKFFAVICRTHFALQTQRFLLSGRLQSELESRSQPRLYKAVRVERQMTSGAKVVVPPKLPPVAGQLFGCLIRMKLGQIALVGISGCCDFACLVESQNALRCFRVEAFKIFSNMIEVAC